MQQSRLISNDGELVLISGFFDKQEADSFLDQLMHLSWQEEQIKVFGRLFIVPRLVCWYGDINAVYSYSGVKHQPLIWDEELLKIKRRIENFSHYSLNSVLANLYRDGNDSMGWHADKEKELGQNPAIASLSLGDTRLFKMRHCKTKEIINIDLEHGDLLLMSGPLQHHWQHSIPKTQIEKKPRINLTYRKIINNKY